MSNRCVTGNVLLDLSRPLTKTSLKAVGTQVALRTVENLATWDGRCSTPASIGCRSVVVRTSRNSKSARCPWFPESHGVTSASSGGENWCECALSQAVTAESEEACAGTSVAWMPTSSAIVLVITAVRRRTDNGTAIGKTVIDVCCERIARRGEVARFSRRQPEWIVRRTASIVGPACEAELNWKKTSGREPRVCQAPSRR